MLHFSVAGRNHTWDDGLHYTKETPPQKNMTSPPHQKQRQTTTKNKLPKKFLGKKNTCKTHAQREVALLVGGGSVNPRGIEDTDGDGFLYSTELKSFAAEMGFEGSDSEWNQEKMLPSLGWWEGHVFFFRS